MYSNYTYVSWSRIKSTFNCLICAYNLYYSSGSSRHSTAYLHLAFPRMRPSCCNIGRARTGSPHVVVDVTSMWLWVTELALKYINKAAMTARLWPANWTPSPHLTSQCCHTCCIDGNRWTPQTVQSKNKLPVHTHTHISRAESNISL